ncbi:radical SAM protein, putative [Plasmodium chabaudi chabaudi]|uniref:Threonylcarbamoyladenosine tRNA methylthiotransferase n=1 Tax=Plasmodium chabaudi chabaudi TaxID=31271 RepID=A0A1C6YKE7_PLACU|nr:radical SAM protein, putative [Plasmodium chabaudi chabaudi]
MTSNKIKVLSLVCLVATGTYYACTYKKEVKNLIDQLFLDKKTRKKKNKKKNKRRRKNGQDKLSVLESFIKKTNALINWENEINSESSTSDYIKQNDSSTYDIDSDNDSYFAEYNNISNGKGGKNNKALKNFIEFNDEKTRKPKTSSVEDANTLTDVEDINNLNDRMDYNVVQIKKKKKHINIMNRKKQNIINDEDDNTVIYNNFNENNVIIPENYNIYFKSFGCAHNSSDSEFMMGLLSNYGFQFVKNIDDCDICIVNSCTVKNPSEESMKTIINYVNNLNKSRNNEYKKNKQKKRKDNTKDDGYLSTSSSDYSGIEDKIIFENPTSSQKKTSNDCSPEMNDNNTCCGNVENQKDGCGDNQNTCGCTANNDNADPKTKTTCCNGENDLLVCNESNKVDGANNEVTKKRTRSGRDIKIIVCGCVPQAENDMKIFENVSLVGVNNIDKIVDAVENVINGYNVKYLKQSKKMTSLNLPKIRKNKFIEIININNGCLGNCTYCKTKFARGNLSSYNIKDIVSRIKHVYTQDNIKEIWLTSEDSGAYGIDLNTNIVNLLKEILDYVQDTDIMIRIGMTNPPYILKHVKDICKLLKHKNMYEFIHIPVQSGSNNVLKDMNREYKIEDFIYLVDNLRKYVPNMTIATDIICGFPYESENDHLETVNLVKRYKFPILNISQFYPRRGTVAYNMKKIDTKIVKKRSREVTDAFLSYQNNYEFLQDTIQKVLFTEISSKSEHIIGHTKQYVKVLLHNNNSENENLLGKFATCKIVSTHKWHVFAELV